MFKAVRIIICGSQTRATICLACTDCFWSPLDPHPIQNPGAATDERIIEFHPMSNLVYLIICHYGLRSLNTMLFGF